MQVIRNQSIINLVPFVGAQLALKLESHIKEKSMKIKKLLRNYPAEVM
jgi:hypothetical protein